MGLFSSMFSKADINEKVAEVEVDPSIVLLDVRTPEEFASGHIPGSVNVPVGAIAQVESMIPNKDTVIFTYCAAGPRAHSAASKLVTMGYVNAESIGGISAYRGVVE